MPPEPPRNRLFDLNPIHRSHPLRMDRKRLRETQHQQGNLKTMKRFHRMLRCGPSKPAASYPPYGSIEGTIRHHVHGKPAGTQTERLQRSVHHTGETGGPIPLRKTITPVVTGTDDEKEGKAEAYAEGESTVIAMARLRLTEECGLQCGNCNEAGCTCVGCNDNINK